MDDDETYTLCPGCGLRVEPTEPSVIYAVKMERRETMGGAQYSEGMGAYFHDRACYSRAPMTYREKPKP